MSDPIGAEEGGGDPSGGEAGGEERPPLSWSAIEFSVITAVASRLPRLVEYFSRNNPELLAPEGAQAPPDETVEVDAERESSG